MRLRRKFRSRRGQSVVEFALILPVIMFLLLGMVEMGFAINHNSSMVTATRQGARVGSELVDGTDRKGTNPSSAASQGVDTQIIAAVQGVLISPGSPVDISQVQTIQIFRATDAGAMSGSSVNTWIPAYDAITHLPNGPAIPGSVPTAYLSFSRKPLDTGNWDAKDRSGVSPAQSIGVRITYTYKFVTPLGSLIKALGGSLFSNGQITMSDQTIMAMEPPSP